MTQHHLLYLVLEKIAQLKDLGISATSQVVAFKKQVEEGDTVTVIQLNKFVSDFDAKLRSIANLAPKKC